MPMDYLTKPEFWQQQWAAFTSAIWIMLPLFGVAGFIVWRFRGWLSQREISGLKAEISTADRQLKLATESMAAAERARDELFRQYQAYKAEVAAKGSKASSTEFAAALEQLKREDAIMTHALKVARQAVESRSLPVGSGYPDD
jgi:hypothetical protein